jgi:hypothetical protein
MLGGQTSVLRATENDTLVSSVASPKPNHVASDALDTLVPVETLVARR